MESKQAKAKGTKSASVKQSTSLNKPKQNYVRNEVGPISRPGASALKRNFFALFIRVC